MTHDRLSVAILVEQWLSFGPIDPCLSTKSAPRGWPAGLARPRSGDPGRIGAPNMRRLTLARSSFRMPSSSRPYQRLFLADRLVLSARVLSLCNEVCRGIFAVPMEQFDEELAAAAVAMVQRAEQMFMDDLVVYCRSLRE